MNLCSLSSKIETNTYAMSHPIKLPPSMVTIFPLIVRQLALNPSGVSNITTSPSASPSSTMSTASMPDSRVMVEPLSIVSDGTLFAVNK